MAEAGDMLRRALAEQDDREAEFGDHHQREGEQAHRQPWCHSRRDGEAPHAPARRDPARREHHRQFQQHRRRLADARDDEQDAERAEQEAEAEDGDEISEGGCDDACHAGYRTWPGLEEGICSRRGAEAQRARRRGVAAGRPIAVHDRVSAARSSAPLRLCANQSSSCAGGAPRDRAAMLRVMGAAVLEQLFVRAEAQRRREFIRAFAPSREPISSQENS
eukprot:gene29777-39494_t